MSDSSNSTTRPNWGKNRNAAEAEILKNTQKRRLENKKKIAPQLKTIKLRWEAKKMAEKKPRNI